MSIRRFLAAVLVTVIALVVPATAAHAEPPEPEPIGVHVLWPLCVTVSGWTICIPA